jgi:hypothetical protein
MRKIAPLIALVSFFCLSISSCEEIARRPMSEAEVARGLKEALAVGTENSVSLARQANGFFNHPVIKIPFPPEAMGAYNYMNNSSVLRPLLNEFVLRLNRAAEDASVKAKPIFLDAITGMTVQDAWGILRGEQNAATTYLHRRTYEQLYEAFKPDVLNSLNSVGAATAWQELTTAYNAIARLNPSLNVVTTDLADYTTTRALDGLFFLVEQEEAKIRTDPAARVTDLLRRVFAQQ